MELTLNPGRYRGRRRAPQAQQLQVQPQNQGAGEARC